LNKTSSQRIITQFGPKHSTANEYQSKKSGKRVPQPLRDIDVAQNDCWVLQHVVFVLYFDSRLDVQVAAVLASNWSQNGNSHSENIAEVQTGSNTQSHAVEPLLDVTWSPEVEVVPAFWAV
jgi:hypothetical protein